MNKRYIRDCAVSKYNLCAYQNKDFLSSIALRNLMLGSQHH